MNEKKFSKYLDEYKREGFEIIDIPNKTDEKIVIFKVIKDEQ